MISKILGQHFGYPACCVQEYLVAIRTGVRLTSGRLLHNTGFVPCKSCNATKTETALLQEIAANRKHNSPFPVVNKKLLETELGYRL